jgi:hypothetical protein
MIQLFHPGHVTASPTVLETVDTEDLFEAMRRHVQADWGNLSERDQLDNEHALILDNGPLLSRYITMRGQPFFVLTVPDRSATKIFLPNEAIEFASAPS